jgi:hypothetical protein
MFIFEKGKLPGNYQVSQTGNIIVEFSHLKNFADTLYADYPIVQKIYKEWGENVKINLTFNDRIYYCQANKQEIHYPKDTNSSSKKRFQMQLNMDTGYKEIINNQFDAFKKLDEVRNFPFDETFLEWQKRNAYLALAPFSDLTSGFGPILVSYENRFESFRIVLSNETGKYVTSYDEENAEEFNTLEEAYEFFKRKEMGKRLEALF